MSDVVVKLKGLHKAFKGHLGIGRTVAVDGLDLEVRRGEIVGLLGPNGSGKTTTMKMMLGLLRPDRGSIELLGRPPEDPESRARIGYLPENPYFYDYLTAREFLDFYARLHAYGVQERHARVEAAIERVGLAGRADRPMRKFSKGMVQRVALAQAIQHDPDLILLDEPMSGLDPVGRREVRDIVLSLRDAGKTVFFSSHILQDAELICDRVAILRQGHLVAAGALDEMLGGEIRFIEVALRGNVPADATHQVVSSDGGKHLIRLETPNELTALLAAAAEEGSEVLSVWTRRDTLEDLFLKEVAADAGIRSDAAS